MAGYWQSEDLTFFSAGTKTQGWQATLERYQKRYQAEGKEMGKLTFSELDIDVLSPESAVLSLRAMPGRRLAGAPGRNRSPQAARGLPILSPGRRRDWRNQTIARAIAAPSAPETRAMKASRPDVARCTGFGTSS